METAELTAKISYLTLPEQRQVDRFIDSLLGSRQVQDKVQNKAQDKAKSTAQSKSRSIARSVEYDPNYKFATGHFTKAELIAHVNESLAECERGQTKDAFQVLARLREAYGV